MMKIIFTSLLIGSLFIFSEAGLSMVKSPISEEDPRKRTAAVDILNLPTISKIKITSAYSENEGLKITCEATGENLSYDWSVQNGTLRNNEVVAENVLSIHHVTKENDRIFCCKAFNTVDSLTKCIRLPALVLTSDPLVRIVDSSAEMFCEVIGTDQEFDIKWKRADGSPLPNNTTVNDGFLKLPKLATTDTGIYVCVGLYKGKTEAFRPEISLKVVSSPEIVDVTMTGLDGDFDNNKHPEARSISLDFSRGLFFYKASNAAGTHKRCERFPEVLGWSNYEKKVGNSVELECTIYGAVPHKFDFKWSRENGSPLPKDATIAGFRLKIPKLAETDAGIYLASVDFFREMIHYDAVCKIPLAVRTS